MINGTAYSWSQISVNILGVTPAGVKAITYESKQNKTNNYGAGNDPISRGKGQKEYSASITLEMADVEAIQAATPNGDLTDVSPFNIVVSYLPEDGVMRQHTLTYCEFTGNKRDVKQGDSTIDVQLDLIIGPIKWK